MWIGKTKRCCNVIKSYQNNSIEKKKKKITKRLFVLSYAKKWNGLELNRHTKELMQFSRKKSMSFVYYYSDFTHRNEPEFLRRLKHACSPPTSSYEEPRHIFYNSNQTPEDQLFLFLDILVISIIYPVFFPPVSCRSINPIIHNHWIRVTWINNVGLKVTSICQWL